MDGVAYLIHKLYSSDSIGQKIPIGETKQEIYVSTGSINRNEWFNAGRNGMNPEILLTTAAVNYSGEDIIEYDGVRYGIYRTYQRKDSDEIELYLHKKGGINGTEYKN